MKFFSLFIIFLCSCNKVSCVDNFQNKYSVFGEGEKSIILSHGIWSDEKQWSTGHSKDLVDGLVKLGHQVITYSYPNTDENTFNNNGICYRKNFINFYNWMLLDIEKNHGMKKFISGGFSFGGLHSIIATSEIDKLYYYFGIMPTMDINVVMKHANTKYFRAENEKHNLKYKKGFIISGLQDNIARHELSKKWSDEMGLSVQHLYVDLDHRLNDEIVNEVIKWVDKI